MSNPDFKQEFENSLQRLAQINSAINANIKGKQDFSARIIQRLSAINEKVKQLGDSIKALKDKLSNLEAQASTNNSQIVDISTQVNTLKTEITQLTNDRDKAITELEQLKNLYKTNVQDLQKKIDDYEEKLRQLTDQNGVIIQQRDALDAQLKQTGDLGTAHAEELKKITEQHALELQQKDEQLRLLQEDNTTKMKQLQDEITVKENELNKTVTDIGNNAAQLQSQIDQLTKEKQDKDNQIAQLQGEITQLQNENQDLITRIVSATQAIAESTNRLQELNDPTLFNEAELDAKFQEVEASIQQISNAIQGNPVATNQLGQGKLPPDTQITVNGENLTLKQIVSQLRTKPQKDRNTGGKSKYALALDTVSKAQTPEQVVEVLNSLGIIAKNGGISGGKKTKKRRKQKGGYTYKLNSKRKSIATSSIRSSSGRGRRYTNRR